MAHSPASTAVGKPLGPPGSQAGQPVYTLQLPGVCACAELANAAKIKVENSILWIIFI